MKKPKFKIPNGLKSELRPYQMWGVLIMEKRFKGRAILADEPGLGKAQPLDSKLLTPDGWMLMGDVMAGDLVIGSNGQPTKVTGIFPQGVKKVYEVTFRDGAKCQCTDDHLWLVKVKGNSRRMKVRTLREIRKSIRNNSGTYRYRIPVVQPVDFRKRTLPMDPYLMGYLLANGSIVYHANVCIPDRETAKRLTPLMPSNTMLSRTNPIAYGIVKCKEWKFAPNPVKGILKRLGLWGKHSYEKHIPKRYLFNSIENRIALFQGLMDGDGCVSGPNVLQYSSSSHKLAKHVKWLVQSFGGTCTWNSKYPTFTHKGIKKIGRKHYILTIALPDWVKPFRLSRKANLYHPRTKYKPTRIIESVRYVGEKECQCIKVDAKDSLYVTDDFIVTHNTVQSLAYALRNPKLRPIIVVCPKSLKWNWEAEIHKHTDLSCYILEGMTKKNIPPHNAYDCFIINYEVLKGWMRFLLHLKPGLIILDEAHRAGNYQAKVTGYCKRLCKAKTRKVLALTGTPITNHIVELHSLCEVVKPGLLPPFFPFARRFVRSIRNTRFGWQFKGVKNEGFLNSLLKDEILIRRKKQDVLKELPKRIITNVPIVLDPKARKEYDKADQETLAWLRQHGRREASEIAKLELLKQLSAKLKLPTVMDWVNDFLKDTNEKLILFAIHRDVVKKLHKKWQNVSVMIHGGIKGRDRQDCYDAFNYDPSVRLLIGNSAAYEGWSASDCSHIGVIEFPWNPGKLEQLLGRFHGLNRGRKGQISQAHFFVAEQTIDELLLKIIQSKMDVVDKVIEGHKTETTSVFGDLFRQYLRRKR